jgi:DNA polymerase-3 subunit delta'
MGFEGLLGNARLKENLRRSVDSGRLSHFYLISGPKGSGKRTLALLLAAAAVCRDENKPCLTCPACRKAMTNNHPDIITVTDPDHKAVAVKIVREYREDVYIKPNEADKKVYIFPQELGTEGQNALLKILEEPPSYGVFILLAENPQQILTTVRSRCTLLQMESLPKRLLLSQLGKQFPGADQEQLLAAAERSGGYLGQAAELLKEGEVVSGRTKAFAKAFLDSDPVAMTRLMVGMEKTKRDQAVEEMEQWLHLLQNALSCRSGLPAVTQEIKQLSRQDPAKLLSAIRELEKAILYLKTNVSVAAVCSYLQWQLL